MYDFYDLVKYGDQKFNPKLSLNYSQGRERSGRVLLN